MGFSVIVTAVTVTAVAIIVNPERDQGLPLQNPTVFLVPTLCVGMPVWTLRVLLSK
jgi:hypothetical protein